MSVNPLSARDAHFQVEIVMPPIIRSIGMLCASVLTATTQDTYSSKGNHIGRTTQR